MSGEPGGVSEKPGKYQRSTAGVVGSMIVLVAVMAVFVGFRGLVRDQPEVKVEPVDYAAPATYALEQAPFVLAPAELPEGWVATSVRFTPGSDPTWHLGTLTDDRVYVGLEQAADDIPDMVDEHVGEEAKADGEVTVAGEVWLRYREVDDDDLALAREVDGVTTLVVGRVGQETLESFIATLETPAA